MTFEQLLYVEVLSHYKSLQEAADVLHITKSGLSLAISQLEDELNVKLYNRSSKGTFLTDDGIHLLSKVSDILKAKADLEKLASFSSDESKKKVIRIRYVNTFLKIFIEYFINHFEEKFSQVFYDISCSDTKSIIEQVRNGEIDVGFIANSDIESEWIKDLIYKPIAYGKVVLGASKNNSLLTKSLITFDDLKDQKFCIYNDIYHEHLLDRIQYICGPLNLILKTDDHWAISQAVTKLNAVVIGRSTQGLLSRDEINEDIVSIEIGHLINDSISLGWLINPATVQSDITIDLLNNITEDLKNSI